MDSNASNDQQNSSKSAPCCCGNKNQEIVPIAAPEEKNQLISKIIRILIRAVGIFVARKVILWAIGFGPYGVIPRSLATKLIAYAQHSKVPLKGLVALLQSGGTGFTPSKGYIAFVAGQIIFVVAPELKSRLMQSHEELTQQYGANMAKVQIVTKDIAENSDIINSGASLRPKLQINNSPPSPNKDLETQKIATSSKDLQEKTDKFYNAITNAAIYYGSQYIGVPGILIPVVKSGFDLIKDPAVHVAVKEQAGKIGTQIGSTASRAYSWTAGTASSAKDKTVQTVSTTYNYTKEKTSQGLNYSWRMLPTLRKTQTVNTMPKLPGPSYGIAHFGNPYRRSLVNISQEDNGGNI